MSLPESKALRIAYVCPNGEFAGSEASLLDLFSQLDRRAFRPLVIVPSAGPFLRRLTELGIESRVLLLHQLKAKNPWLYLQSVWRLTRLLMKEKVDLIHANYDICNQYAIIPAKLLRIPIICHVRDFLTRRGFRRMFLSFSDVLIANSNATFRSYSDFGPPHQRRVVVYNSVDQGRLSATTRHPRNRWAIPEDAFVALQMARIAPSKGQHIFLEALFRLMPNDPHLYAVIAGDTKINRSEAYLNELKARVRQRSLDRRILFTGFVGEVGDLLSAADVLVVASQAEAFGRVLIEAMMLKKPVIATRAGGPAELIRDGETGVLVAREPAEMAKALARMMTDRAWASALAVQGQAWATARFSPSNTSHLMEDLYRETLGKVKPMAATASPTRLPKVKKLHVLYLSSSGGLNGAEMSLVELLMYLDRSVFQPIVIVPAEGLLLQRLREIGVDCRVMSLNQLKMTNPWPYLRTVVALGWLCLKEKIDLIHVNMDICNQYAIVVAKVLGIPVVCHARNILSKRGFQRMFMAFSDVLIANSKATLKSCQNFWPLDQRRILVYNTIDQGRLRATHSRPRSRWDIPERAFVALQMARINPSKAQHVFLEALIQLMPRYPDLYALIAGDTKIDHSEAYRDALQAQVLSSGLEKRILFTGYVPETGDLLSAADTLVLTTEFEPFGRVIVEAMMWSKPVIATHTGGPGEIIQDGETGLLIPPGDSGALAQALSRLMENRLWASDMGKKGRDWAEAHFSSPRLTLEKIEEVYRETVERS